MKPWNSSTTIIASLGLIIAIWATAIMSNIAFADFKYLFVRPPMNHFDVLGEWPLAWIICTLGLVPALIGGLKSKPRFFWPLCVAIGAAYCLATCIVIIAEQRYGNGAFIRVTLLTLWMASPGIAFIIEGLIIRHLRKRQYTVGSSS